MSLKDLFGKNTEKIVSNKDLKELQDQVESEGFLQENIKDKERFLPAIDFSSSSNFAKYGSAEKYYNDAFENIYNFYPYDGSLKEKQQWLNSLTQFDLYVYDNIYPKTTGYINLGSGSVGSLTTASVSYRYSGSPQYVVIKGGPNASPTGKFNDSNIYNVDANRESNLALTENGNTVEFWFKDNVEVNNTYTNNTYCLFDLWNGNLSGSHNYTRLTIENSSSSFYVTYASGTIGVQQKPLNYSIDKANWHHYAFVFANNSNNITISLYVDGEQVDTVSSTLPNSIGLSNNKGNIANIGSFRTNKQATEATSWNGIGNCFGSIDEFRFWKSTRSARQIYRYYFTHVNGGSNTDDSNTNLGVYYKFNEGIISPNEINSADAVCLDYSGRISNGTIKNYALNVRSTGSAIDTFFEETKEPKDAIVIPTNSLVSSTLNNYLQEAKDYDQENSSNIYRSLPAWITEEDENIDNKELKNLIQTISSYFDTLHLQIEALSKLGNIEYSDQNSKPKPFIDKILSSHNFDNLEIFNDTTFIEDILSRNETKEFDKKINDIKNVIYQNIYNNLAYIYKSKGTEKSLRNLIRCFGVDDELIKINLYASNSTYEFNEKYKYVSALKKFVDFNDPNRYVGTVIQKKIINNDDSRGYIAGKPSSIQDYSPSVVEYLPLTLQAEIIFPKKVEFGNEKYDIPTFSEVSLFGVHTANNKDTDLTWGTDPFNFHVLAVKRNFDSSDVYFKFTGSLAGYGFNVTSSWYKETYNNEKWNLAVRLKPQKYALSNVVSGSSTGDFLIELLGYNSSLDVIQNSFILSQSIPEANAKTALLNDKRVFAGAHYSNFNTSSILHKTDVKISSVRYWLDYLTDEEIKVHSFDVTNYGRLNPDWKPDYSFSIFNSSSIFTKSDTLLLNWDFSNVSSSDENGEFIVYDLSSGSNQTALNSKYGILGQICKYHHGGFGTSFYENDTQVINKEYIHSAKQLQPEVMAYSDTITTPDTDDVTRTKDSRPVSYYISIEKSMAQVINDQMINWFATIKDFNNLIGDPSERYRKEYKGLQHLRKIYFQNVKNTPDFEKFITFYKWIDSSISTMISQLIPASANVSNKVRNIVESHLLERSKYENKLPTLELKGDPVTSLSSFLEYKYEDQAAPGVITNSGSVLWIKERAERSAEVFANPSVSVESQEIRDAANFNTLNKLPTLYSSDTLQNYVGKRDEIRKFNKPYKLETSKPLILEATIKSLRIGNEQFTGRYIFADELADSNNDIFNTPKNGYSVDIKVDLPEEYNKFEPPPYRPKPGGFLPGNYINESEIDNSYYPPAGRSYVLGPFLEREGYWSFSNPYQYGGNDYGFLSQFTAADGLVNYAAENIFDNGPDNFGKIFASTPNGGIIVAGPNKSPTAATTNRDKLYVYTTASDGTYFLSRSINFGFGVNGGSIGPTTVLDNGNIYTVANYYDNISLSYKYGLFENGNLSFSDNFLTAASLDAQGYPLCSIAAGEGNTYYIGLLGADGGAGRVIELPADSAILPPNPSVQGYGKTVKYISGSGLYVAATDDGSGSNAVFGPSGEIYYPSSSFSSMVGVDFGASIAGSGDVLVFGAPTDQSDNDSYVNGLVYVYKSGQLQTTLSASGVTSLFNGDQFGSSVSVSKNGKLITVGAPKANRDSQSSTIVRQQVGYVAMWYYDGSQWLPDAAITNNNFPSDYDRFGTNVLITDNLNVIVTAPRDDVSNGITDQGWKNVGSVQIFKSTNPQTLYDLTYTDPVYTYSKYSDGLINWGPWGGGGAPVVGGEGAFGLLLAIYGSEYSIYKSLNYINLRVRDTLDKWLAESASIDSENPSYHKTPKNPAYLPTKTQYDNAFVTHQIPRSDTQYAWITASIISKPQFSGYITQYSNLNVYNSSSFQLLSGNIKYVYETPSTNPANINLTSNLSSSAYSGTLYDSGGPLGNYSSNEEYYFTIIPTSSIGSTFDSLININYTLTSSISSSVDGSRSKLKIYSADDAQDLKNNFLFPDKWTRIKNNFGSDLYLTGALPVVSTDPTEVYDMTSNGNNIVYIVGNFTAISSSNGTITIASGVAAYNYDTKIASNPIISNDYYPPSGNIWLPERVTYTKVPIPTISGPVPINGMTDQEVLVFGGKWTNTTLPSYQTSPSTSITGSNNIQVYNLTLNKWNQYITNLNYNTNTTSSTTNLVRNLNHHTVNRIIPFVMKGEEQNGRIGILNSYLINENGNIIKGPSNLYYFDLNPSSVAFCSASVYVDLKTSDSVKVYPGYIGNDLYVGSSKHITGSLPSDSQRYNLVKINTNRTLSPITENSFFTNYTITQLLGTEDKLFIKANGVKSGTIATDDWRFIYDPSLQGNNYINITGGYDNDPHNPAFINKGDIDFIVGEYYYTLARATGDSRLDIKSTKYDSVTPYVDKLLRYNYVDDTDNYFNSVAGNKEPLDPRIISSYNGHLNAHVSTIIGKNLPITNITSSIVLFAERNANSSRNTIGLWSYNATRYKELNYASSSQGSNITSSINFTGSNILITWLSNNVLSNGFQINWNKTSKPIVIKENFGNYLNIRSNGSNDYNTTDVQLSVNTNTNTILFANSSSYNEPHSLNDYLSNLNGPYQHPSWKQIRNIDNKLVIETRKNNLYLVRDLPVIKSRLDENNKLVSYVDKNDGSFTSFKEPPVTYNFPMEHLLNVTGSRDSINVISSYDNNKKKLSNTNLANRLGIKAKDDAQTHDILIDLEDGLYYPKPEIINVKYTTNIFPSDLNVGIKDIRNKPNYEETSAEKIENIAEIRSFWKNSFNDRVRPLQSTNSFNFYNKQIFVPAFTKIKNSFRIGKPANSLPTSPENYILNLTKSNSEIYDTIWSLDNIINYTYNSSSLLTPLSNYVTSSLYLSSSYISELAGHDDWFELRNIMKKPVGGFYYRFLKSDYTASLGTYEAYDIASAAANELVALPKPSLGYKLHIPSTIYYGKSPNDYITTYTFINKGFVYKTNEISGKNPWFNSYEEYFADIKPHSKNYSLLPEYKISDHMEYYVKEKNGDFNSIITGSYLTLDGVNYDYSSITSSFNITNNLNTFIFNDVSSSNKSIKFTINAIKKLLPYKGFYPSERATQLVSLFQKSFFGFENDNNYLPFDSDFYDRNDNRKYITSDQGWFGTKYSNNTPIFQQMQTVLQTMFAPGILFNTIKSGIAVDWPAIVLNNNELYYSSNFNDVLNSSLYTSGNLETSSSLVTNLFTIGRSPNVRMDFESIIDFKKSFDETTYRSLFYVDPSRLSIDLFSGSDRDLIVSPNYNLYNESRINADASYIDNRYKLAINNYLAEIPNFFLQNSSLTTFISRPSITFQNLVPGKRYEMNIKLSKDENFKMVVGDNSNVKIFNNSLFSDVYGQSQNLSIPEASCFGPPYKITNTISGGYLNHNFYTDPAFAPYVPPYFYGERTLKVYLDVPSTDVVNDNGRRWEVEEILSNLKFEESFPKLEDAFLSSSIAISGGKNVETNLANGSLTIQQLENVYRNSPAYKGIMPLTASINLFGKTNTKKVTYDEKGNVQNISDAETATDFDSWVIQTKFETPVLDFNNVDNINSIGTTTQNKIIDSNSPTHVWRNTSINTGFAGIWSGYGNIPAGNSGIKLSISNTLAGNSTLTKSLADVVGFETVEKKIGQVASSKEISEAIVLIPYTSNFNNDDKSDYATTVPAIFGENGFINSRKNFTVPSIFGKGLKKKIKILPSKQNYPFYFKVNLESINKVLDIDFADLNINKSQIIKNVNNILKNQQFNNNSILKTIKKMSEYNLPTHLDWLTNRTINPFVMYIIEFKHTLDQQDLTDIWQGVMPKIAIEAELDDAELTHDFGPDEFFHGKNMPPDIKWKIFKVKKKANINYYSLTADNADDEKFKFKFNNSNTEIVPDYSYNWPYDFFSLVELANINIELESDRRKNIESDRKILFDERVKTNFKIPKGLSSKKEIIKTIAGLEEIARRAFNSLPNRNIINPARGNFTNIARTIFRENTNAVINRAINIGANNAPQTNNNPGSSFGIGRIR